MKTFFSSFFICLILLFKSFAGQVTLQYGDDIVIDCTLGYFDDDGIDRYYSYGDDSEPTMPIHYYSSNDSWERYYYKTPIPLILTEAAVDSAILKIYRPFDSEYSAQSIKLAVNLLTENLPFEYELGHDSRIYNTPSFDLYNVDTSDTIPYNFTGWISINITDVFNKWILNEFENYGIVIKMFEEKDPTQQILVICASNYPEHSKWPKIEVNAPFLPDTLITSDGQVSSIVKENIKHPKDINIEIFPNPFNSSTEIMYELLKNELVDIYIYNYQGEIIKHFKKYSQYGMNTIKWFGKNGNGNNVSSGVYICVIKSKNFMTSGKMVLIK